jgi:integrase
MTGIPERTNHGFSRRTFVIHCYRTGMPEVAIMRLSRHKSIAGLRAYAG